MRIAVEGCCHGELDAIYQSIKNREQAHGYKVDLLLICGDFQSIRNEADLDTIACPRKYLQLGTFHKYYSGECKVPVPTVFVGGNHEVSNYLWELYHGGWVCPGIYFLGFGGVINVGGLRIGGMSGIYKPAHYETGHFEITPYNDNHKRSVYHVRRYDVYKMLQIRSNTLGSIAYEHVLASVRPAHWFSAHLHVRFTAVVEWGPRDTNTATPSSQSSQATPPVETATPEAVKNPDEIDIAFDDEDDEEQSSAAVETLTLQESEKETTSQMDASASANPDEISIDLSDDDDDSTQETSTSSETAQSTSSQSARAPVPVAKPYPTTTQFLALDKCEPKRQFLEIIDLPHIQGPVEFNYDEEWLAIVRTLDQYLSLEHRQKQPLQGQALKDTLDLNREWVKTNITQKQGLAIPHNFEPTAPSHDPVRTLGHQEKQDLSLPFLNPQTAAFCNMLQIPNKINPHGRRA
ncbi:lariat debranching enzyme [Podila epicladia]|nr:lariat debranching enzyme [Podila epicladia]